MSQPATHIIERTIKAIQPVDRGWLRLANQRQSQLTKPAGSLGELETIANRCAAIFASIPFSVDKPRLVVFAADHGVCEEGVSAFPQSVTAAMVRNFVRGGAAINCLARVCGADLTIVDVGVVSPPSENGPLTIRRIASGTRNFCFARWDGVPMKENGNPDLTITRLWLIRHGEPLATIRGRCYGRLDASLSEAGQAQMQQTANALRNEPFAAIYASPRIRTRESAEIVSCHRGIHVQVHDELSEIDFGEFEGRSHEEIEQWYPENLLAVDAAPDRSEISRGREFCGDASEGAEGHSGIDHDTRRREHCHRNPRRRQPHHSSGRPGHARNSHVPHRTRVCRQEPNPIHRGLSGGRNCQPNARGAV
ncbi:MAG: nicotinate-nucleotide--dimethylbenzimidazole phosphoribosyltransferase [Chloroflexi bacterium]|nr:nicotinate-nucleotide--dimethylbenzimidazole phosphoribosyltransferase [Chloroflexota bacterium]